MPVPEATPLQDWAASGAMALTGRPDGPPLAAPGAPASRVRQMLERTADLTRERTGNTPSLPGVEILGERAAIAGFTRQGPRSCGGSSRVLRTDDGWLAMSLPRCDDLDLVPALIENDPNGDHWEAVAHWAERIPTAEAAERARLLGLACAPLPPDPADRRAPVVLTEGGPRKSRRERPRVIDLTSLWAGPLCAHLLGLGGAVVVKVESTHRPDGARLGPVGFFDLLHAGHRMVSLDFRDPAGVARLRDLVADADLVLEASRPRALQQLGIHAEQVVSSGVSWLSITAHGRDTNLIGFGDDVAAGAGLILPDGDDMLLCGDALADPLAGVYAAAAASEALTSDRALLIDVSMHHAALDAAGGEPEPHAVRREGARWWVESQSGRFPVADPVPRSRPGRARPLGADNAAVLG